MPLPKVLICAVQRAGEVHIPNGLYISNIAIPEAIAGKRQIKQTEERARIRYLIDDAVILCGTYQLILGDNTRKDHRGAKCMLVLRIMVLDEYGSDDSEEKANSQANEPDLEREQFRSRPLLSRATFLLHHFLAPSRTRAWF